MREHRMARPLRSRCLFTSNRVVAYRVAATAYISLSRTLRCPARARPALSCPRPRCPVRASSASAFSFLSSFFFRLACSFLSLFCSVLPLVVLRASTLSCVREFCERIFLSVFLFVHFSVIVCRHVCMFIPPDYIRHLRRPLCRIPSFSLFLRFFFSSLLVFLCAPPPLARFLSPPSVGSRHRRIIRLLSVPAPHCPVPASSASGLLSL